MGAPGRDLAIRPRAAVAAPSVGSMSKNKGRHVPNTAEHDPADEHGYAAEAAREESRQHALAAREKTVRTQMPPNSMRVKRGNQPRGGGR